MTRRLLDLFGKILMEIKRMERENNEADKSLTIIEKGDLDIITKMYRQQKNHFQSKDCRESIKDRIVSISRPYVRPIVRGKEVKSVEFDEKDRATGFVGSCLGRKHENEVVLFWDCYILVYEK